MIAANFYLPSSSENISGSQFNLRLLTISVTIPILSIFVIIFISILIDRTWGRSGIVQEMILDSAEDGIVVIDKEDLILHENVALSKLFNRDIRKKETLYLQDVYPNFTGLFSKVKSAEMEIERVDQMKKMSKLKEIGIRISLDDFGTDILHLDI